MTGGYADGKTDDFLHGGCVLCDLKQSFGGLAHHCFPTEQAGFCCLNSSSDVLLRLNLSEDSKSCIHDRTRDRSLIPTRDS